MAAYKMVKTTLFSIWSMAAISYAMDLPTDNSATTIERSPSGVTQEFTQRFNQQNEYLIEMCKSIIAGIVENPIVCFQEIENVLTKKNPEIINDVNQLMSILVNSEQLEAIAKSSKTTPATVKACIANKVSANIVSMQYKTIDDQHFKKHIHTLDNDQLYLLLNLLLLDVNFYDLTNNINACTQIIGALEAIFERPMPDILSINDSDEEIEQQAAQEHIEYTKMVIRSLEGIGAFLQMQTLLNSKQAFEQKVASFHHYLTSDSKEIRECALVLMRQVYSNKRIELIQKLDLMVMQLTQFARNIQHQIKESVKRFEQFASPASECYQSSINDMFIALETFKQKRLLAAANLEFFGRLLHVMLVEQRTIFYTPLPTFIKNSIDIVKIYLTRDTQEEFEKPFYQIKRRQEKIFQQIAIDMVTDTFLIQYRYSIDFYTQCYQLIYETLKERGEKTKRQSRLEFIKKYLKIDSTILTDSEGALPEKLTHKPHAILIPNILKDIYHDIEDQSISDQSLQPASDPTLNLGEQSTLPKKNRNKKTKRKAKQRSKKMEQQKTGNSPIQKKDLQPAPVDHSYEKNTAADPITEIVCKTRERILQTSMKNKKATKPNLINSSSLPLSPTLTINHDPRILRWFKKKFREQHSEQNNRYHSFALCTDQFLVSEGILKQWHNHTTGNTDRLFEMPGKIVPDLGKALYCIFHCCLDNHSCCYHRGITYLPGQDLAEQFGLWNIDMQQEDQSTEGQFQFDRDQRTKYRKKGQITASNPYFVAIRDHLNRLDLTIFRPCEE